jgi:hypothetical protein
VTGGRCTRRQTEDDRPSRSLYASLQPTCASMLIPPTAVWMRRRSRRKSQLCALRCCATSLRRPRTPRHERCVLPTHMRCRQPRRSSRPRCSVHLASLLPTGQARHSTASCKNSVVWSAWTSVSGATRRASRRSESARSRCAALGVARSRSVQTSNASWPTSGPTHAAVVRQDAPLASRAAAALAVRRRVLRAVRTTAPRGAATTTMHGAASLRPLHGDVGTTTRL